MSALKNADNAYAIESRLMLVALWREGGHHALADAAEPPMGAYGRPGDAKMRHERNVAWHWLRDRAIARGEHIPEPVLCSAPAPNSW